MIKICIVVNSLPASSKSTLAGNLSAALCIPRIDKGNYLQLIFSQRGVGD